MNAKRRCPGSGQPSIGGMPRHADMWGTCRSCGAVMTQSATTMADHEVSDLPADANHLGRLIQHEALKEAAGRDATLGVGHTWTNTRCPAYRSLRPSACTCQPAPRPT